MTTTTPQPGTTLDKGQSVPPSTTDKAKAGFLWGLFPVVLGAIIETLRQANLLFPDAPSWVLSACAAVLLILGPVASYVGVYLTPNRLLQSVTINDTPKIPPSSR
jgi:hypothetical protein